MISLDKGADRAQFQTLKTRCIPLYTLKTVVIVVGKCLILLEKQTLCVAVVKLLKSQYSKKPEKAHKIKGLPAMSFGRRCPPFGGRALRRRPALAALGRTRRQCARPPSVVELRGT